MDTIAASPELEAVRRRRADLRESLVAFEQALTPAAAGDPTSWGERVYAAARRVEQDFAEHIEVTEGPDGLHQSILAGDLRLANPVAALTTEHIVISAEVAGLLHSCRPPVLPDDVVVIREMGTRLLRHVVRHRQRGADLIYDAYDMDLGGGD